MPAAVVSTNRFGNVIVRGVDDRYYRIIPESLDCLPFATSEAELLANMNDDAFVLDWEMKRLVEKAEAALGVLSKGRVYYLVIPSVLGGSYSERSQSRSCYPAPATSPDRLRGSLRGLRLRWRSLTRKMPNQSTDPTLASGTPGAKHQPRHP